MLLTISTTHSPASDLGYLLHKNPGRVHEMALPFGTAVMFYPHLSENSATFALALDIDPVALVRGKKGGDGGLMSQYVSDRPYAASSFLSVAIAKTLRNALGGSSKERADLAETAIPLSATVLPLPVRGSDGLLERLFAPLGYDIEVEAIPLDDELAWMGPEWQVSPYVRLTLSATCRLSSLLSHLYVLIPVLDHQKHYFVDRAEIDKLLAKGRGMARRAPGTEMIATRYLRYKRSACARGSRRDLCWRRLLRTRRADRRGRGARTGEGRSPPRRRLPGCAQGCGRGGTGKADPPARAAPGPRRRRAEGSRGPPHRRSGLRLGQAAQAAPG